MQSTQFLVSLCHMCMKHRIWMQHYQKTASLSATEDICNATVAATAASQEPLSPKSGPKCGAPRGDVLLMVLLAVLMTPECEGCWEQSPTTIHVQMLEILDQTCSRHNTCKGWKF